MQEGYCNAHPCLLRYVYLRDADTSVLSVKSLGKGLCVIAEVIDREYRIKIDTRSKTVIKNIVSFL